MKKILLPLLMAPLLGSVPLAAAAPTNLVWLGACDTDGDAQSIQVVGTNAYVADAAGGLRVISVGNPSGPTRIGGYDTPGETYGVYVVGQAAYVADGPNGLEILDISDPARPSRLGGYSASGSVAYSVRVRGNLAYLADGNLKILDVQNPASPALLCDVDIVGAAVDLRLTGNYVCFAAGRALSIYEVSNPTQPFWVTNLNVGYAAFCLDLAGQYAYLVDENTGLHIVDVSDPVRPAHVGQQAVPGVAHHVAVAGDCAYVVHDVGYHYKLSAFNVADPAHSVLIVTYDLPGSWANCLAVLGDYVLVANGQQGLVILQAQPPQRPKVGITLSHTNVLISWPASALGFVLESKSDLTASNWFPILAPPQVGDELFSITRPVSGREFYQLRRR